ncbi:NhaP-type Na+/H+ or K+/H+ antiporter [Bosea robiniae]|uniref:cation:proton antiporter n=1 Tax=Bosea TaxID=85413 RepID=UPI0028676832|nr:MULTISPECIES: sodium:proton antiporter [Bosea]MDR6830986.1 NhaP-type Na+/H+ or K+/H+ antiporter [Bosea robiniae]MDR6897361.1 NhaP-type Na+/H+ or K+/H+ antiporter [Bosea sp. BE109]MDR7140758.1 NhaP-type Na+/H+ or K+/H+ antiporter [Bosea sp. BE168]
MQFKPDLAPDPYILVLTGVGVLVALVVWLPLALRRLPFSLPIVCLGLGAAIFSLPWVSLDPMPMRYPRITERLSEIVVIIALMGAGLKLDRVFDFRTWGITWRLIAITMPLSIAAITLLSGWWLSLSWTMALLLGSALAPTDPVLAADVQVGPPGSGEEDEVRFGLTSEAGLNDGFAFPFVHLAIALSLATSTGKPWLVEWLTFNVLWEIGAGVAGGYVVGKAFGWLTFHAPARAKFARTGDGLIAISATFVSYGLTELLHCYGFLAVFVTALTFRHADRDHDFQLNMHELTEQVERLAMMALLLLLGGALVSGLLAPLGWLEVATSLVILLVIRPVAGLIGLWGHNASKTEKATIAFFGIRGVGSVYYLAYGLNHIGEVDNGARLWSIVGLTIFMSVVMHGITVTPLMRVLDRRHGRNPDGE